MSISNILFGDEIKPPKIINTVGKDKNDKAEIEDADVQSLSAWRVTINSESTYLGWIVANSSRFAVYNF